MEHPPWKPARKAWQNVFETIRSYLQDFSNLIPGTTESKRSPPSRYERKVPTITAIIVYHYRPR